MNSLLKLTTATFLYSAVTACGVLQPAPQPPQSVPLPSPALAPLITTAGKSVDGTAGVRVNESEIQPEGLSAPVTDDQTGSSPAIPVELIVATCLHVAALSGLLSPSVSMIGSRRWMPGRQSRCAPKLTLASKVYC